MRKSEAARTGARIAMAALLPAVAAAASFAALPARADATGSNDTGRPPELVEPVDADATASRLVRGRWYLQGFYANLGLCNNAGMTYRLGGAAGWRCDSYPNDPRLPWALYVLY